MSTPVTVHVWSDIACPWCYIGKRRLEAAIEQFDGEVLVEHHAFELAPDTPVDFAGSEVDFLAGHKGLPAAQVEEMLAQMTELAAGEGLAYDFAALQHTKTLLAHQAIHHARALDRQDALVERLFRAYFEEGRHVGRVEELVALAAEVGLDAEETRAALESGRYADAVRQDIAAAQEIGIRGVPFHVVDGRYAVSGAQSPDVFLSALERVRDERAVAR